MSQEIFRFVYVSEPRKPPLSFRFRLESSGLASTLIGLAQSGGDPGRARTAAQAFLAGAGFAGEASRLAIARRLNAFLADIQTHDTLNASALARAVESAFNLPPARAVALADFRTGLQQLGDGILALSLAPAAHPTLLADYVRLYRGADLIQRAAEGDDSLDGVAVRSWRRAPLEMPSGLYSQAANAPALPDTDTSGDPGNSASLRAKLAQLDTAVEEILMLGADDLRLESAGDTVDEGAELLAMRSRVGQLERAVEELASGGGKGGSAAATVAPLSLASLAIDNITPPRLVLAPGARERLSPPTRTLLNELGIDTASLPVSRTIARIEGESERVQRLLDRADTAITTPATVRLGTTTLPLALIGETSPVDAAPGPNDFTAEINGDLRGWAVGSLLLTEMQIMRYETGEAAHIENVLIGETKERETRRLRRTEQTTVSEIETTKEEERDLQTTERMEMQREVQNTIKESEQFKLGASISAGYGPFVQASFNTEFATESSSENVARNASNYSREIVDHTAQTITERIREEQTLRVIEEFEERNLHRLDGAGRDEHIIGIFQWVDKVYQARVLDYGTRLLCNLCIPEPARFLLQAVFAAKMQHENAITPPDPLDFGPDHVSTTNYTALVKKFGAKGVTPPPAPIITLSAVFEKPSSGMAMPEGEEEEDDSEQPPETTFTATQEKNIPNGYKAVEASVIATSIDAIETKGGVPYGVVVFVGQRPFGFINPDDGSPIKGQFSKPLDDEVGSIPIALVAQRVTHYVVSVEIECHRTSTALAAWRLQTYAALQDAYLAREAEYRERLAEQAAQEGIVIEGRNPLENRRIERAELKRLAISLVTRQQLSGFGAYHLAVPAVMLDFERAAEQSRIIRFFEDAFEWENMGYEFDAYFWVERHRWANKLLIGDSDPLHAEFLRAGAARVRLPVRPDFEAALFHYLNTDRIWEGGELPPIVRQNQAALLAQILERRASEDPHQRIPVGEPWEVRLPTTLVRVSPSSALPRWEQDENGNWQPVENP